MGTLVGREGERVRARAAIATAAAGSAQVLLLTGEPGIGKTRLAERIAADAAEAGFRVAWGRAWEAGGAPAFWPWTDVFRALQLADPFSATADASMSAGDVRFRRFEEARRSLEERSVATPLAIMLDDLHVADVPSLTFLHFLARVLDRARMLVVGTYRDVEARLSAETASLLAKVAREGEILALRRLDELEVATWVLREHPTASEEAARRVHVTTEGIPLFVSELLRVGALDSRRVPDTMLAVLDEHLARVPREHAGILEAAAILGRRARVSDIAVVAATNTAAVQASIDAARHAGVLEPIDTEQHTFTHILLRDRVYARIAPATRAGLHARAGQYFARERDDLATAAHHLLNAGAEVSAIAAASISRDAASLALSRLAFEDAARLAERALDALSSELATSDGAVLQCELEIVCAEALIRMGDAARGRTRCARAASLARAIGSPALGARAALAYGAEIASGTVDDTMIELLRDALRELESTDASAASDALRARVMARLGAALNPPRSGHDKLESARLSRDALALARRLDDPEALLFVAQLVPFTISYDAPPDERFETIRLVIDLATRLDRSVTVVQASPWWIANLRERSRTDAMLAFERYARRVQELPQPQYQWRVPMVRAMLAMLDGELDEAERLGRESLELAERGRVAPGIVGWAHHRIAAAMLRGDRSSIEADADRVIAALAPTPAHSAAAAWALAVTGRSGEARERLERATLRHPSAGEPHLAFTQDWLVAADAAVVLGHRAVGEMLLPLLEAQRSRGTLMFWGIPHGTAAIGPVARFVADLEVLLGRFEDARRHYDEAIQIADRMAAPAFAELARQSLDALPRAPCAPVTARASGSLCVVELTRRSGHWRLVYEGRAHVLQPRRGLEHLARLLAEPTREVHVLELASAMAPHGRERGEAILDKKAKAAFRDRIEQLRDVVAEAELLGDTTRAAHARSEIDAIAAEMARALGLGGRDRTTVTAADRARAAATQAIRRAVAAVKALEPELGGHLETAVKTGFFCAYRPDPRAGLAWRVTS